MRADARGRGRIPMAEIQFRVKGRTFLGVIVIVVVVEAVVRLIDVALVGVIDDHVGGGGELGVGEDLENLFK